MCLCVCVCVCVGKYACVSNNCTVTRLIPFHRVDMRSNLQLYHDVTTNLSCCKNYLITHRCATHRCATHRCATRRCATHICV